MKLPTTLLQTLAVAVASLGAAGCGSATSNEPTNPSPSTPGVIDPQGNTTPQPNAPGCEPGNNPQGGDGLAGCPACGRG